MDPNQEHNIIKNAFNLSKQPGKTKEAYNAVLPLYQEGELSDNSHLQFGWIAYRYLKDHYPTIGSKASRTVLATYFKLNVERPSLLHSVFLVLAINIKKQYPDFRFSAFMDLWGYDNFRNEDWQPYVHEQYTLPSTVQKVINMYVAEIKTPDGFKPSEHFLTLLSKAVAHYPKDYNIARYLAQALITQGKKDDAIQLYRKLLLQDNRFYLWNELGKLLDDASLQKSALCMALLKQKKEEFVGAIHLSLAELLIAEKDYPQALFDLNKYRKTYESNGWPLKYRYKQLMQQIPPATQAAKRENKWLRKNAEAINIFVLQQLPTSIMVLRDVFTSKKGKTMCKLLAHDMSTTAADLETFPLLKDKEQIFFRVFYTRDDNWTKVVHIEPATDDDAKSEWKDNIKMIEGKVRITEKGGGKRFGFVSNCYVDQQFLNGITSGTTLKVIALKENDRLRAIKVIQ